MFSLTKSSARLAVAAVLAAAGAALFSTAGHAAEELDPSTCGGTGTQICERVCSGWWIWENCDDVKYWSQQ